MSSNGAGFVPIVTVLETTKSSGKVFVNLQIMVGDRYVKFDPIHWRDLVNTGNIICDAAMHRRNDLVEMARDQYEEEEYDDE